MTSDARVGGEVLSDAELIAAARAGESVAFAALYERHSGAALTVARQYSASTADAEDVVAEGFTKVFAVLNNGGGPDIAFRAYLFTVVRRLAMTRKDGLRRTAPTDDIEAFESFGDPVESTEEPMMAGFERSVVSRAYATLPERWQAVLWYSEVENLGPAQIAPLLGLTPNGVAALSYRAREGLRQAYLQQHLQTAPTDACRPCTEKLGAYVRGGLARRETAQVQAHLDECADCRAVLLELSDVNHGMRTIIAPLILGLAGAAALAHQLPIGGGLLVGTAASAGRTGTSAGSGAASEAGGAGSAASTGAVGGASSGAASGVAVGAAGAGGVASSSVVAGGGLLGFLGSLSGGAIAAAVAAVLVVGGIATVGLVSALSGADTSASSPTNQAVPPGVTSVPPARAGEAPATGEAPSAPPVPGVPGVSGADLPATTAIVPGLAGTRRPSTGTSSPAPAPSSDPTADPTPSPTPAPSPTPTPSPTTTPTVPETSIHLASASSTVTLAAGSSASVGFTLENTGTSSATDLLASVTLPPGLTFLPGQTGQSVFGGSGRSFRLGTLDSPSGWTCVAVDGGQADVECRLAELRPGETSVLSVPLSIARTTNGGDVAIDLDLSGTGIAPAHVRVAAHVTAMSAIVRVVPPDAQAVTAAEPSGLGWAVENVGGQPADELLIQLTLPAGLAWDPTVPVGGGWRCTAGDAVGTDGSTELGCTLATLPADARSVLRPTFVAATSTLTEPRLSLGYVLRWTGATAASTGATALTVVPSPGEIALDGPPSATFVVGTPRTVTWTVRHVSGPTLHGVVATITPPAGVVLESDAAPRTDGWTCADDAHGTIECSRDSLEPGAAIDLAVTLTATSASLERPTGAIQAEVRRDGSLETTSVTTTTTQLPGTAVLSVAPVAPVRVVVGETASVVASWQNTGGTDANGPVATVTLPAGVHGTLTAGPDGACTPVKSAGTTDVWECTYPQTAPGHGGELTMLLTADPSAHGVAGLSITIALAAPGAVAAPDTTIPVTVASPVLELGSPAPLASLIAGQTGTLAFTVANTGDAVAHHVAAAVELPAGVALDASMPGGTACTSSDGTLTTHTVVCDLGDLAAGSTAPVVIGLRADAATVADLLLTISADGLTPVERSVPAPIATNGLSPRYTSGGTASTVTEIGAPLLTCAPYEAKCAGILGGTVAGNNNDVTMVPLNAAGGDRTSSSATLDIPQGSTVTFAGLYWSANAGPSEGFDGPLTAARLRAPGTEAYQPITGTVLSDLRDNSSRRYYQSFADVTGLVAAAGGGTWSVADIAVAASRTDVDPTYYAGWSLVVVYTGGASAGNVTVYDGGAWVASSSSVPFAFQGTAAQRARLGVVAWEGDRATTGDRLSLNGAALTPWRWNPATSSLTAGDAGNAFDSTATGSAYVNALGVDAKGFASAPLVNGVNTVMASTSGDQYLIGVLTVTSIAAG